MSLISRRQILAGLVPVLGWVCGRTASAQVGSGGSGITQTVGNATLVVGAVTLLRAGQSTGLIAQNATLVQGDQLETAGASEVHIAFEDGGYLALRPNSSIRLDEYVVTGDFTDTATINLLRGALRSVTGWIGKLDPLRYRVTASTATISVRGTDHEVVIVSPQDATTGMEAGVHNLVNEGATVLANPNGSLNLARGTAAYAAATGLPPLIHPSVPALFNRLRTAHDRDVSAQARSVRQRMEEGLRARAKLLPEEHFDGFRRRQAALQRRSAGLGQPSRSAGGGQVRRHAPTR